MNQRLGKSYKLTRKTLINNIFAKGSKINSYPILLRYSLTSEHLPASFQIAFSVPKRNFKKAVDRNKVKRLLREVVRKNKGIIEKKSLQSENKFTLFLIYTGKEIPDYDNLEISIQRVLKKLPSAKDND
tara:strand:+ start:27450 stop:27836 length:387 start_codon:yes stop_codon:yes gene_type:complete